MSTTIVSSAPLGGTRRVDATSSLTAAVVASAHPSRWRWLAVLLLVVGFMAMGQPAVAQPQDVNSLPEHLRKYASGTPQWTISPWMTSASCRDRGGDFSIYAQTIIADSADLLAFFQPNLGGPDTDPQHEPRKQALLQGYRDLASQITVPPGYCVDDVRQWAVADPNWKPFGFRWGDIRGHQSGYLCPNQTGAELAPCEGFYVSCDGAVTLQEHQRCEMWNAFSDDYIRLVKNMRQKALDQHSGGIHEAQPGDVDTKVKSPGEIMQDLFNWVVKKGMEQVVSFVIDGVTKLWASFLKIAIDYTTPNVTGAAFTSVYNLVAGVALALAFLGWLVTLATSWKRGHLQFSLLGGLKAAVGVTLAGVGAILMLQLADQCTKALATAGGDLANQADFTPSLAKVNPLVAVFAGVMIAVFLVFAIIFLVLHSALVLMWALMGSIAAAGQVHPASSGWTLRWFSRLTALAWAKFVMVAVMLLAITLLRSVDAGEDTTKQVVDVVQGLALAVVLVSSPYLLWELVDFVADRVGGGHASGGPATQAAGARASALGSRASSPVTNAVSTMMSSAADLGRRMMSRSAGGDGGAGPTGSDTQPPSPENAAGDGLELTAAAKLRESNSGNLPASRHSGGGGAEACR